MMTVKDLREALVNVPDSYRVVFDSQEQSAAYYAEVACIQTVQEPEDEDIKDDMYGDVGYPEWVGDSTDDQEVLWISRWNWRG